MLNAILEQAEDLREVDGLRSVKVNPLFESELEARFIEALGRVEVDGKPVRLRQDIVAGKPGFVLTTAGLTYYVEAQVGARRIRWRRIRQPPRLRDSRRPIIA